MKFFRNLFSKNTYHLLNLSKEVFIAILLIILPIFYPSTVLAGIFSYKVSAKAPDSQNVPNSQTMGVLKAVVNSNPAPSALNTRSTLAIDNALVAEIGPSGTSADVDVQTSTEISTYVVRAGDTLSEIAALFDVSVNTILWANNIEKGEALKVGQTLVILPITGIRHTVKSGDTIKGIVLKYKADLDEVLNYNDLTLTSKLTPGDIILIPDAEFGTPSAPVKTGITVSAGYYSRPIVGGRKSQGIHGHNGVDLAAPVGTSIFAAASGTVIASMSNGAWNGGYGNYVIISHPNGTQTVYAHNSMNAVAVGEKVKKGQFIGKIGMTGKTTGPHVHFEIRGAKNPF